MELYGPGGGKSKGGRWGGRGGFNKLYIRTIEDC